MSKIKSSIDSFRGRKGKIKGKNDPIYPLAGMALGGHLPLPVLQEVADMTMPEEDDPPPPPPVDTEGARRRARESTLMRRGRRASILTSQRGVTAPLGTTNQPRASALLGGGGS